MAVKTKTPSHMWTIAEAKIVLTLWNQKTKAEVAEELGVTELQLQGIVAQLRKAGFNLPKKHKNGHLRNLLEEMAKSAEFRQYLA